MFLDQALDLLPADYWRWWLAANAPEGSDAAFSFERFAAGVNNDLADTFGNLVNRVLKFVIAKYDGVVPAAGKTGELEHSLAAELTQHLANLKSHQEERSLRKAADEVRAIWSVANAYLVCGCAMVARHQGTRSRCRRRSHQREPCGVGGDDSMAVHTGYR